MEFQEEGEIIYSNYGEIRIKESRVLSEIPKENWRDWDFMRIIYRENSDSLL